MIDYSLSISTYIQKSKFDIRFPFLKECIESFCNTKFEGILYLVDDGSDTKDHLDWIRNKNDSRIWIIEKPKNSGISKTKNTGIRMMFSNKEINYGFLCDDDMVFKDKEWFAKYIESSKKSGIHHFSYALPTCAGKTKRLIQKNNYNVYTTDYINGCFLFLTKELVNKIGYFKIFDYNYGHEHSNYTIRATNTGDLCDRYYDIENSETFIDLNMKSWGQSSININVEKFNKNEEQMRDNVLYRDCVE